MRGTHIKGASHGHLTVIFAIAQLSCLFVVLAVVTLPDSHTVTLYQPVRSFESVPRREMASGHRRNGDVPVVGHPPPGFTRSAVTQQQVEDRPFWRRIAAAGGFS